MNAETARSTRYEGTVAVWFSGHYAVDPRDWRTIEELGGPYGNHIEPAVEYGFTYVDMAARLLGREAETRPYGRP